jgi:hypothetical protein
MKSSGIAIIFATVFGVVLGLTPAKGLSDSLSKRNDTKAYVLANGSEKEFVSYVREELNQFAQTGSWNAIEEVVTIYNRKPFSLQNISAKQRQAFQEAVVKLNFLLDSRNTAEAQQWKRNLNKTASSIRFIWNVDLNSLTPVTTDIPPMGVIVTENNL